MASSPSPEASAARLPMETKEERQKRRAEKKRLKEEKRKRKAEKAARKAARAARAEEDAAPSQPQASTSNDAVAIAPDNSIAASPPSALSPAKRTRVEDDGNGGRHDDDREAKKAARKAKKARKANAGDDVAQTTNASIATTQSANKPASAPPLANSPTRRNPFAPASPSLANAPVTSPTRRNPFAPASPATTQRGPAPPASTSANPFAPHSARAPSLGASSPPFFPHRQQTPGGSRASTAAPRDASPTVPHDTSDFPPGFDVSALSAGDAGSGGHHASTSATASGSGSGSKPATRPTRKQPTSAALDAILRSGSSGKGKGSQSGGTSMSRGRVSAPRSSSSNNNSHESIGRSKEATVADATGLTERQILSEKLYQPHQIKWLQEAGLLTNVYQGKFTRDEHAALRGAFETWCEAHSLSRDEGIALIHERTAEQAQMYAELTTSLAASIEGRTLRSVRRYALENFHSAKTGPWTDEEVKTLEVIHSQVGPKWSEIAKRMGRLSRDVRVKYRDTIAPRKVNGVGSAGASGRPGPAAAASSPAAATAATAAPDSDDEVEMATSTQTTATSTPAPRTPAATPPSNGFAQGPWSRAETETLDRVVRERCAAMDLDLDGSNLPWKSIALSLHRSTHSCMTKWFEIRAKLRAGQDPFTIAKGDGVYVASRDDVSVVRRILATQQDALDRNDVALIQWAEVVDRTEEDGEDANSLPFNRSIVAKAFRRLMSRLREDKPDIVDTLPLRDVLRDHALPRAAIDHDLYKETGKNTRGVKTNSAASEARLAKAAEKEAEREAKRLQREEAKAERERAKQEKKKSEKAAKIKAKARSGTKAAKMKKSGAADQGVDGDGDAGGRSPPPSVPVSHRRRSESVSPRKARGKRGVPADMGGLDEGDAIDSDEE